MSDLFIQEREQLEREQETAAENTAKQLRINFGVTFSTPEGFEVLKALQSFCHDNEVTYWKGDTHETAFREGERNVFLFIKSQLSTELRQKL
ncbi:MAG: hypothetical protein WCY59_04490 [Anaerovoracaceae bacterium]